MCPRVRELTSMCLGVRVDEYVYGSERVDE